MNEDWLTKKNKIQDQEWKEVFTEEKCDECEATGVGEVHSINHVFPYIKCFGTGCKPDEQKLIDYMCRWDD